MSATKPGLKAVVEAVKPPSTYITGHCGNGCHEGKRTLSGKGELMPACRGEYSYRYVKVTCTCWCHEMFKMLRESNPSVALPGPVVTVTDDQTSVTVDASGVKNDVTAVEVVDDTQQGDYYDGVTKDEDLSTQLLRFIIKNIFGKDPNSEEMKKRLADSQSKEGERRKRGSLDVNVEVVCRLWVDGKLPYKELKPQDIAIMVDALNAPSQGAVHAVLTRWEKLGLVKLDSKPVRFVSFEPRVYKLGIKSEMARQHRVANNRAKGFF